MNNEDVDATTAVPAGGWKGELAEAVKNRANGASASKDEETPIDDETFIDPTKFPQTSEGLAAFLTKIDGPHPLFESASGDGDPSTSVATYRAKSVSVEAGTSREVPIPVWTAGSKVSILEAGVDDEHGAGVDVGFGVFLTRPGAKEGGETEHEAMVTVLMEPGRIVTLRGDTDGAETPPPAMEFTVGTAPSTVVLTFDNSYSWLTPKMVSYEVQVSSPVDMGIVHRSRRAEKALEAIIIEIRKGRENTAKIREVRDAVEMEAKTIEEEAKAKDEDIKSKVVEVEKAETAIGHAEDAVDEKRRQIREVTGLFQEAVKGKARIEGRIKELKMMLAEAESELSAKAKEIYEREDHVEIQQKELRDAKAVVTEKREEMKRKEEEVKEIVAIKEECREKMNEVAKECEIIKEKEEKAEQQNVFLKAQFDALQLRLLEKLQEI